jgi:hypothetical protein
MNILILFGSLLKSYLFILQSVESKYQTIKSINHQLELKILEIKSQSSTGTL